MTNIVWIFVLFFTIGLFLDWLPFVKSLQRLNFLRGRILYVFQSKTFTDYRKERLLKCYALRLFLASVKIAFLILIVTIVAYLLLLFVSRFLFSADFKVFEFIVTVQGFLVSVLAFIVYYLFKRIYVKFRL